ncbi:YabP/YqfC family sporulation protein [Oscillospiraceae bacterium NSJ-54]|uniref:YabP/YqfC family sporulation protein n=1 Tax=Zongyangia hominis TaxID=2763677 RepID=A0A926EF01_9FIRM|nr:YabP/YqfC family sporulation protein [Zongyangia hominis]
MLRREKQRNRRPLPPEKEIKPKVTTKVAKVIGVPEDAFSALPQIELSGNREAVVEGCQGILEYDENVIRLSLGRMMLRFCGRNLQLRCMAAESVVVEGYIMSMEFLT